MKPKHMTDEERQAHKRQIYRNWYAKNRERMCRKASAYYWAHREEALAKGRASHQKNKAVRMLQRKNKLYGMKPGQYEAMEKAQGGRCAICGRSPRDRYKRLQVDHDHQTGSVRALLCHTCNYGIGIFSDDPKWLDAAVKYLERYRVSGV